MIYLTNETSKIINFDYKLIRNKYRSYIYSNILSNCNGCNEKEFNFTEDSNCLEVSCESFQNVNYCIVNSDISKSISEGDKVIVNFQDCIDAAVVAQSGFNAHFRLVKDRIEVSTLPNVLRKVNEEDENILLKNLEDENKATPIFRELSIKYNLEMKLIDVHFQFDRKKLFFFYTSDGRVDFRELAKELAGEFRTRIELRQIGVRDEAKKIGGIATCGREFCCSSYLTSFKRITTQLANDQNLSTNMSKLSGPCGKLKCCLSYETQE